MAKMRKRKDESPMPEDDEAVAEVGGDVPTADTEAGKVDQPTDEPVAVAEAGPVAVDFTERRQAHYDEIVRLNEVCLRAGYEYEDAKLEANAAKKRYEQLQGKLNSLISQGANPQMELKFPADPKEAPKEAWKDVPIGEVLQMTDKQAEKLEAAGIKTVGQFEHLRSGQMDGYPDGLRSVKGVGEKTVDAWEDQMSDWWSVNVRDFMADATERTEGAEHVGPESEGGSENSDR